MAIGSGTYTCGALGPGYLGAILSVATSKPRGAEHYRRLLQPLSQPVARYCRGSAGIIA